MSRTGPISSFRNGQCRDGTVDGGGGRFLNGPPSCCRDNTSACHWQRNARSWPLQHPSRAEKGAKKIEEVSSVRLRQGIDRRMTSGRCMGNLLKPTEAADNVVGLRGTGGGGVTTTTTRLPPVPPYTRRRALTPHHHTITRNITTTIKQPKTDRQSVRSSLVFPRPWAA